MGQSLQRIKEAVPTPPPRVMPDNKPTVVIGAEQEEDRDTSGINQHLQVSWQDVIGEPAGVRSPECAWRVSTQCFQLSRNCCYLFLSVICAPLYALCLGCTFACLAFDHIWCITPCLRVWKITCFATRICMVSATQALVVPVAESLSHLWGNIRVRTKTVHDDDDHQRVKDPLVIV